MKRLLVLLFIILLASPSHAVLLLDGNVPPGCTASAGVLTCTGFAGDGSGLTGVTAGDDNETLINRLITAGTAAKALALNANGANCSAGQAPLGVDAAGAVESCFAVQASDATLTALAGLSITEGSLIYGTAADTFSVLAKGGANSVLRTNAGATAPEWSVGFTVDADGDVTAKSYSTTRVAADSSSDNHYQYVELYEDKDDGDNKTILRPTKGVSPTISLPATTGTLATLTGIETLTNKTLMTPIITALEVLIDCSGEAAPYAYCTSANASTLTATQVSRTIINSYGRGEAQTVTLPAAATGMTFIAMVGTQDNSAWKIQRAGSDTITWSSGGTDTTGKTYFQETNQPVGSRVSCITYKSGASAWSWLCGSVTGTWVTD